MKTVIITLIVVFFVLVIIGAYAKGKAGVSNYWQSVNQQALDEYQQQNNYA